MYVRKLATLMLCVVVLTMQPAFAGSEGRIPENINSEWTDPNFVDYFFYLDETRPKKKKEKDLSESDRKKQLKKLGKLAASTKVNKVTISRVLAKQADLLVDQALEQRRKELAEYNAKVSQWLDSAESNKRPEFSSKESDKMFNEAIAAYRELMNKNPKHQNRPDTIHKLAMLLGMVGNENAELYFKRLLKVGAKSRWRGFAMLGLAEYYYANDKVAQAKALYGKTAKLKNPIVAQYARYKEGWLAIKEAQKANSFNGSNSSFSAFQKLAKSSRGLREQAMNDLVYAWSEVGAVEAAQSFFSGKQKELYINTLERVAWKRVEAKKYKDAIPMYEMILASDSRRLRSYRVHGNLATARHMTGDYKNVVATMKAMEGNYLDNSAWMKANKGDKPALESAKEKIRSLLVFFGLEYHKSFKEKKDRVALAAALDLYGLYIKAFPTGDESYKIRYAYADALDQAGQSQESARQYLAVVKMDNMDGKFRENAAEKMLALQMAYVKKTKFPPLQKWETIKKPLDIPGPKSLLIEIADTYVKYFSGKKKSMGLRYVAGRTYMEYGHFKEGIGRLDKVVKEGNGSPEAKDSVRLILKAYASRAQWDDLVSYCQNYQKLDYVGGDLRNFVRDMLRLGMWKQAEGLLAAKKTIPAAKAFMDFQKEFPQDKEADLALFKASGLFYKEGMGIEGIKSATMLVNSYTKSKYRPDAQYSVGKVYEELVEYEKAALSFVKFSALFRSDKRAAEAMYRAAGLYQDAENLDASAKTMYLVYKQYGSSSIAPKALLRFAELKEETGDFSEAQKGFMEFVRRFSRTAAEDALYARAKAVTLAVRANNVNAMKNEEKALVSTLAKLKSSQGQQARNTYAEFQLAIFKDRYSSFGSRKIGYIDLEVFTESEKQLQTELTKLERDFNSTIAVAGYETQVEALYQLGVHYENALNAYKGSPKSDEISAAEVGKIQSAKEKASLILRDKMQKSYEKAVAIAKKYKLYIDAQSKAQHKLSRLQPGSYRDQPEELMKPEVITHKVSFKGGLVD